MSHRINIQLVQVVLRRVCQWGLAGKRRSGNGQLEMAQEVVEDRQEGAGLTPSSYGLVDLHDCGGALDDLDPYPVVGPVPQSLTGSGNNSIGALSTQARPPGHLSAQ